MNIAHPSRSLSSGTSRNDRWSGRTLSTVVRRLVVLLVFATTLSTGGCGSGEATSPKDVGQTDTNVDVQADASDNDQELTVFAPRGTEGGPCYYNENRFPNSISCDTGLRCVINYACPVPANCPLMACFHQDDPNLIGGICSIGRGDCPREYDCKFSEHCRDPNCPLHLCVNE